MAEVILWGMNVRSGSVRLDSEAEGFRGNWRVDGGPLPDIAGVAIWPSTLLRELASLAAHLRIYTVEIAGRPSGASWHLRGELSEQEGETGSLPIAPDACRSHIVFCGVRGRGEINGNKASSGWAEATRKCDQAGLV